MVFLKADRTTAWDCNTLTVSRRSSTLSFPTGMPARGVLVAGVILCLQGPPVQAVWWHQGEKKFEGSHEAVEPQWRWGDGVCGCSWGPSNGL